MIHSSNIRRFFYKTLKQPDYAFSVFVRRLMSYLSYLSGRGKSFYPEAITLFLTNSCNLRCKMCGQWGEGGITKKKPSQSIKEEWLFEDLKALIDDVSSFKPNITLFGGEPLLYPHLLELIRYIKEKNMHCLMITNGSLLESCARDLVDSGLDELNVSLDGASKLHDEIRDMPGLFERVYEGLKKINRLRLEKREKKPSMNLQCTITRYNYLYLDEMLDVAKDIGTDSLTFHNLVFLEEELIKKQKEYDLRLGLNSSEWEGFVFEPGIEPDDLYKKIKEILKGKYSFSVDFYPNFSLNGLREYYRSPFSIDSGSSLRCLSPWMVAYIFPDGEVRPCLNFDYSYGNIKKYKFSRLWNIEQAVRFRYSIKQQKKLPACIRCTELYRY